MKLLLGEKQQGIVEGLLMNYTVPALEWCVTGCVGIICYLTASDKVLTRNARNWLFLAQYFTANYTLKNLVL